MQIFNFQRLSTTRSLFLVCSLRFAFLLLFNWRYATHDSFQLCSETTDHCSCLFMGAVGPAAARRRLGRSEETFGLLVVATVLKQMVVVTRECVSGVSRGAVLAESLGALAWCVEDA